MEIKTVAYRCESIDQYEESLSFYIRALELLPKKQPEYSKYNLFDETKHILSAILMIYKMHKQDDVKSYVKYRLMLHENTVRNVMETPIRDWDWNYETSYQAEVKLRKETILKSHIETVTCFIWISRNMI